MMMMMTIIAKNYDRGNDGDDRGNNGDDDDFDDDDEGH